MVAAVLVAVAAVAGIVNQVVVPAKAAVGVAVVVVGEAVAAGVFNAAVSGVCRNSAVSFLGQR